jgi:hypothetical protein
MGTLQRALIQWKRVCRNLEAAYLPDDLVPVQADARGIVALPSLRQSCRECEAKSRKSREL